MNLGRRELGGARSVPGLRRRKGARVVIESSQAQEHSKGRHTGRLRSPPGSGRTLRKDAGRHGGCAVRARDGTGEMLHLRRPRAPGMDRRTHLEGERMK